MSGDTPSRPSRRLPAVSLALYLAVLATFLLPWVNVSCGHTRTEDLTGVELLQGKDPEFLSTVDHGEGEILDVVQSLERGAWVVLVVVLLSVALSLAAIVWPRVAAARLLSVSSAGTVLGFVALEAAGSVYSDSLSELRVHHLPAFMAALSLSLAACVLLLRPHRRQGSGPRFVGPLPRERRRGPPFYLLLGGIGLLGAGALASGLLESAATPLRLAPSLGAAALAWCGAGWLQVASPTWKSAVALFLFGLPLALIGGSVVGS